ncbi:small ribosomal subunit protein mS26 isoform X2 [Colius striatus]|uniref:small ribosomal subunit protein mS26 isoform X2 n=1 Tax=Colius striatus TaxID=57412 RepID=UPI002B1DF439|nr:small ribosomal subunit protein mS26 isoform X2 [Colius striatus]
MLRALRPVLGPALGSAAAPGRVGLVPARGRKTRHDPPAKSKADRLKLPPPVDPEELLVVTERADFKLEVLQRKREAQQAQEDSAALSQEHQLLMAWNAQENARQRARREERIRKEEEEEKRRKEEAAASMAQKLEALLKEKEKEVLQLQEEAQTFITPENLEERIEECLNNPRNHNFAIDRDGRVVRRTVLS